MNRFAITLSSALLAAALIPTAAIAQTDPDDETPTKTTIGEGEPTESLPPPRSDNDPQPRVAAPQVPVGGVVKQAGVGGITAYGRAGVLELGGSATFTGAADFTQLSLNPSIGWFMMDNIELSGILGLSHISAQGVDATYVSGLVEPSIHIPFSETLFGFAGAGLGVSWIEGPGLGFAFAPRLGLNILIGRSGILTPQASLTYSAQDAIVTPAGTLIAVSLTYGAGIGYTVMW